MFPWWNVFNGGYPLLSSTVTQVKLNLLAVLGICNAHRIVYADPALPILARTS